MDFTVAIRTYNRAKYIPDLLQQLKAQIEVDHINWEIIIIDNNSIDNTAEIIKNYQDNWDKSYPLKYVLETKQGGFYARKRGIKEAKAELIGFLDDDNLPALNWVAQAYLFAEKHPQTGAFGSKIIGEFEGEIPENIEEIAAFFPIITWPETFCFNSSKHKGLLPPGAGLVINKKVWLENVPEFLTLQGPVGDKLDRKGEDTEALIYIQKAGWQIWYNSEMLIHHLIGKKRLEKEYLLNFCRGIGMSRFYTRKLRYNLGQFLLISPIYLINDLRKLVFYWLKYRKVIPKDVVRSAKMEFLKASFDDCMTFFAK